jgi:hypothetical protein
MFASKDTLLTRPSGYQIQRSLRFRSSASAYLNRTPASASNRRTWTWSGWVKRGALGVGYLFGATTDSWSVNWTLIYLSSANALIVQDYATTERFNLTTTMVFRDPSAWYHLVVAVDTTQATASNRIKIYVNGVQVTALNTAVYPTQNLDTFVDNNVAHQVNGTGGYFDGLMAEINFIDGQALTPSSFGAINPVTGVWSATKYAGTYGTNGFYLNFTDNSAATATTIGKDFSGNGNNWTPNNISVTAGVTYDSMLDAPLGAGGGERGNYCVISPIDISSVGATISNGNLRFNNGSGGSQSTARATMGVSSGKYYWETTCTTFGGSNPDTGILLASNTLVSADQFVGNYAGGYSYGGNGQKRNNNTGAAYGATYTTGDVIGVALDMDAGTLTFYKNNTSQGTAYSSLSGTFSPAISGYNGVVWDANFGQRPFAYTPPTGFKALHTGNLAAPVIALPAQNMAATTYTGTGATQSISNAVNSVSMQPDWVWFKRRGAVENHWLTDSVRGSTKGLFSNLTDAEATRTDQLTSFNSNGFTLGADAAGYSNVSGQSYIAWQWKAGGTAVSNTAGSITSSVSANTTAGFSVVTYTGNEVAGATVGHGLGVAPSMIIVKRRDGAAVDWAVYHASIGATKYLTLNTTAAEGTSSGYWNNTAPTSSVFSLYNSGSTNANPRLFVAYCFTPVAGYSAFGSYTGNGSTDGPFVFLGFRPRFVLIKRSSDGTNNWEVRDTSRDAFNTVDDRLFPNTSGAEDANNEGVDFLSNGFKIRNAGSGSNASGATYIYMAFAENPFKNSLAR